MESSPALSIRSILMANLHLDGGTLDIVFENGFLPQAGDTWNLISFTGTEDGSGFDRIVFENAGNVQLESSFNGGEFELQASGTEAVPEPSTFPVLLVLLAAIACALPPAASARTRT